MQEAATRWQQIIVGDVPDVADVLASTLLEGTNYGLTEDFILTVDDIIIFYE
jgi:hypothetical protein